MHVVPSVDYSRQNLHRAMEPQPTVTMTESRDVHIVVVMGVSGAGKTVVGQALARALDWPFYDADDYHSPENIAQNA